MTDHKKIGRNNKSRGKQEERNALAPLEAYFNEPFKRNPDNGDQVADVESEHYVVEVKSKITGSPPQLLRAWGQILEAEKRTGKEPYVVLSYVDKGKRVRWLVQKLE